MMYTFINVNKLKPLMPYMVFFTLSLWVFMYYSLTIYYDVAPVHQSYIASDSTGYLIQTSGCRIPEMFLNGPEVDSYMDYEQKIQCKFKWNYALQLYTSNLTSLILNKKALAALKIKEGDPAFKCYYVPIKRFEYEGQPKAKENYDNQVILGERKHFANDTTVLDEMIEVTCELNGNVMYRDYHVFVRPGRGDPATLRDGDVSVLVLGLDAVSRLNFRRHMPRTHALLSRLGNVEMLGYNKVADNTFPNLMPALAGLSADELRRRCWPDDADYFDRCDFVWDRYRAANFSTAFAEDSPAIGVFNYLKYGFARRPTDHYLRPLMIRSEDVAGNQRTGNVVSCIGSRLGMAFLLDHALKVALSMAGRRYMGVFWSNSLTHDYVEFPRFGDADLERFFRALHRSGELNRTAVVLMSDHGIRWGRYRDTRQGGLEDRLPMLRFALPGWFAAAHPRAARHLEDNAARLTTPYDLHETLLDLADPAGRLGGGGGGGGDGDAPGGRGVSLFRGVPENRTCRDAGVPDEYCACHDVRTELAADDADVARAAGELVRSMNALLSGRPACARLALHRIHRAAVQTGRDRSSARDYELQVTTVPGYGKFEAIVRHASGRFRLVGSVSRLNLYGHQSDCVNDAKTKLLCYCAHQT